METLGQRALPSGGTMRPSPYLFDSSSKRDAWVIAFLGATFFLIAIHFDAFERFESIANFHETWQLDEIATALVFLGLSAIIYSLRRVAELSRARENAQRLARSDELTGLTNRRGFFDALHACKIRSHGKNRWLLLIDLDAFKPINDLYGHRVGDMVLRVTATRIKSIAGDDAVVARIGGDEFGVCVLTDDHGSATHLAQTLINAIQQPIQLASLSLTIGASVGIATTTPLDDQADGLTKQDGNPVETVLRKADMALYEAKKEKGTYRVFVSEMDSILHRRRELESDIGAAIQSGQIIPYYQPMIDLRTGLIIGYEALARWEHPSHGVLTPSIFIPIAERTGTISQLTYTMLRQAMRDALSWPPHLLLSVNLSPRMLSNSWLPQELLGVLTEMRFPAHRLELEITENWLIDRAKDARAVMGSLRQIGTRLVLDDFGAGYAGLSYIRQFRFDKIKFDREFVTETIVNENHSRLIEMLVAFCRNAGIQTTAEGIESEKMETCVKRTGCDIGQGYHYGAPKPHDEVLRHMAAIGKPQLQLVG